MKTRLFKLGTPLLIAQALFAQSHDFRLVKAHVLEDERAVLAWQRDYKADSATHLTHHKDICNKLSTSPVVREEHNRALQLQRRIAILATYE
ncbi:MAG TPA: hypothetical protein ENK93_01295 [Campylobacteraceae bacterium]|nr:hypothetical protein [Campylobacteraceae bacterium]HHD83488.1 hypothetical protein [Campylobacteraceae bacterium]